MEASDVGCRLHATHAGGGVSSDLLLWLGDRDCRCGEPRLCGAHGARRLLKDSGAFDRPNTSGSDPDGFENIEITTPITAIALTANMRSQKSGVRICSGANLLGLLAEPLR